MTDGTVARFTPGVRAALLMIISCLCFSVMSAGARYLAIEEGLHANYIVMVRNFLALAMVLPFCVREHKAIRETPRKKMLIFRALLGTGGMVLWYNALANAELAQVTAVGFVAPLVATLLAIIFFKEKVSYRRWSALAVGCLGVAVILAEDVMNAGNAGGYGALPALGTAFVWAVVALLLKSLSGTESITVILFYMMAGMAAGSVPIGYMYIQPLSGLAWGVAALMCAAALLWQYFMLKAYRLSSVAGLQPFEFFKLLFALLIGYAVFGESMQVNTIVGAIIVIGSAVYITYRERVRNNI